MMSSSPGEKARSRSNSVVGGPSSKAALPAVFAGNLVDRCFERLRAEWQPSTSVEEFLVRELARHESGLERAEQIEAAVLRRGSRGTPMTLDDLESADALADAALAGAGITDALEKISRYRRLHERAYHRSHAALSDIKAASATAQSKGLCRVKAAFMTEADCERYLAARDWCCPRCDCATGRWIPSRKVRKCRECRRQSGVRTGTVLQQSPLPLIVWFRAIGALLVNPDLTTAELAKAIGIHREGTIRRIAKRIREAMKLPDASRKLMGLDRVFLQPCEERGHSVECRKN